MLFEEEEEEEEEERGACEGRLKADLIFVQFWTARPGEGETPPYPLSLWAVHGAVGGPIFYLFFNIFAIIYTSSRARARPAPSLSTS